MCCPDLYATPIIVLASVPMDCGCFPVIAIAPLWTGKVLFQRICSGASNLELSVPPVIDDM